MTPVDEARAALLERIRRETREAVEEGDRQDCSSPDCIADAVYEIARVSVDALIVAVRAEYGPVDDDLWTAAHMAVERGESTGKYHHQAVLTALNRAELRGRAESAATLRALDDALIATLRRDDLCDETDGEHHTDEYIAAFLMSLHVEMDARAALAAAVRAEPRDYTTDHRLAYQQGRTDGRAESAETLLALREDAATVLKMYAPPLKPSDTLIVMAFDIIERLALAATPAEAPKWDVLGAHDEMVRLHGESCDCDVCLVIQEKADAILAATPAERRVGPQFPIPFLDRRVNPGHGSRAATPAEDEEGRTDG